MLDSGTGAVHGNRIINEIDTHIYSESESDTHIFYNQLVPGLEHTPPLPNHHFFFKGFGFVKHLAHQHQIIGEWLLCFFQRLSDVEVQCTFGKLQ